MTRHLLLLVLPACAASSAAPPTIATNEGGTAPPRADASLVGPLARVEDAPELADGEPPQVTLLGRADGPVAVSLVEIRDTASAASCAVALETEAGVFLGHSFLCAATRSDETVVTDRVSVTVADGTATISFRTSYQLDAGPPAVDTYSITCTLTGTLSCTPPPPIGGYE